MHCCLQVPEVVRLIVDAFAVQGQLVPSQYGSGIRREYGTLANLARTCRSFYEPALDAIWYYQADLCNLIKCFPSDSWQERHSQEGSPPTTVVSITFTRPLSEHDFERFEQYAYRVRELCFKSFRTGVTVVYPSMELLRSLSIYMPSRPFLPNLRAIVWDSGQIGNDAFPFCHLFLGANLKVMLWRSTDVSMDLVVAYALQQQQQLSPCAHRLSLELQSFPDVLVKSPGVLCGFKELRSFSCNSTVPLPFELYSHLAELPRLCRLVLSSRGDNLVLFPEDPRTSVIFPVLTHLSICAVTSKACAAFIAAATLPSINNLRVTAYHTDEFAPLLAAIAAHCGHTTLESLTVRGLKPQGTAAPVRTEPLAHLHAFHNLQELTLDALEHPLALDDGTLRGMALAWPRLQTLLLIGTRSRGAGTAVTLDALVPFVRHCPCLAVLHLPLSAVLAEKMPDRRPGGGYVNTSILSLHVDVSSTGDPAEVAAFLTDLFPNLRTICPYVTDEPLLDWKLLERLLPTFAAVRTQERAPLEKPDA